MKAWVFTTRGPPSEVLKLHHDFPQPQPTDLKADEVIVKVSHVTVFAPEVNLMSILPHFNSNPWIPLMRFSGRITGLSSEKSDGTPRRFDEGDAVFGMISPKASAKYNGVLAEYIVVPLECIVAKPANATFEEATGLAASGSTAIGFAEIANLLTVEETSEGPRIRSEANGKRILVTAGSSGTGINMLQFFKHLVGTEGKVVTTASPRNAEAVREYGADEVIDYTKYPKLHKYLAEKYSSEPFDAIIDIAGSDGLLYPRSPSYLRSDGVFAFAGTMKHTHANPGSSIFGALSWVYATATQVLSWAASSKWPVILGGVPRRSFFHSGKPNPRNLELTRQLVENQILKGVVDSNWPMKDALKAFEHVQNGKIRGQVVITVGD